MFYTPRKIPTKHQLELLSLLGPRGNHGYQIVRDAQVKLGRKLKGSVYHQLKQLEKRGWLETSRSGQKVVCTITERGYSAIREGAKCYRDYLRVASAILHVGGEA